MIEARNTINQKLHEEGLPSLSYRISTDYGRVEVARSATSQSDDLFGPTMNMCSKINSKATPNGVAIGPNSVYCYGESDLIDFLNDIPGKHRSVYDVISVEIWHLVINEDTKGCEHLRLFTAISLRDVK